MSFPSAAPFRSDRRAASPFRYRRRLLAVLAVLVCTGIALVTAIDPYAGATAATFYREPVLAKQQSGVQRFAIQGGYALVAIKRDRFTTEIVGAGGVAAPSGPVAPAGVAQAYAAGLVAGHGWAASEFGCLVSLWNRESGWNMHAANPSGAFGIPQALPGSKMGAGWQDDYKVQVRWGVGYIAARYGSPCGAWAHSNAVGSY